MNQDIPSPLVFDPSRLTAADAEQLKSWSRDGTLQLQKIDLTVVTDAAPQLLSPSEPCKPFDGSLITDEDRNLYGDLANLASAHETHRQIAARVVWLDRQQPNFQSVIYAARDRIMHLAVRVADLEAQLAEERALRTATAPT